MRGIVVVMLLACLIATAACGPGAPGTTGGEATRTTGTSGPDGPGDTGAGVAFAPQPSPLDLPVDMLVGVPNPLEGDNPVYAEGTIAVPELGEAVLEGDLRTQFSRVTDRPGVRHEYSRFDPFNADKSMIILRDADGGFGIYRTEIPYDAPANLIARLEIEEPRWDRADPNIVLGTNGFQLLMYDVELGTTATLKDFSQDPSIAEVLDEQPDIYRITMKDEGEASWDGRWWAFALQGENEDYRLRHIFTWDRAEDRVLGLLALTSAQSAIDWVGMSTLGTWVVIGGDSENASPLTGLVIANKELSEFHRIDWATGHADVGLDQAGDEVIVMQNARTDYIDIIPLDQSTQPITEAGGSYEGTNRTPAVRLYYDNSSPWGLNSGVHISCNAPGWALVSAYAEPDTAESNWLDRSIVLVRLDRDDPAAYLVGKTHNTTDDFWEETHAAISNDGATVLWSANFGVDPGSLSTYELQTELPR